MLTSERFLRVACGCSGANPEDLTVWGYDRKWIKQTWHLKAETAASQQTWLQAANGLTFGQQALQRTTSNTLNFPE